MRRVVCWLRGHDWIQTRVLDTIARPGGILPSIDGYVVYQPDPDGPYRACRRCRTVDGLTSDGAGETRGGR